MAEVLQAWGLVSAHGEGADSLLGGLRGGISVPRKRGGEGPAFFSADEEKQTVAELLAGRLERAWAEAMAMLSERERSALRDDCALLFASTKGCVEDYIWRSEEGDPYTPVVEAFLRKVSLRPRRWLTVSNACASSHSALHLAREWLRRGHARHVVVIAADFVGPFVLRGFQVLRALSVTEVRPFDRRRDGLLLGEAAAVAILRAGEGELMLSGTAIDGEGHAVTRPEDTAKSLRRAIRGALQGKMPQAVIAHATATIANDRTEDIAFTAELPHRPWVVGSKWSVGHCLGAAGLVDLIAGAEWLRENSPFALPGCTEPDPTFSLALLTPAALAGLDPRRWESLLITALGFGGVHAALLLEKRGGSA